jgi:hypothetical protein
MIFIATNAELRYQIAELIRGQLSLQSQLNTLIGTLNTLSFAPLFAVAKTEAVAKAGAPAVVSLMAPASAFTGVPEQTPNAELFSHTKEAPSPTAPDEGSVVGQLTLPPQEPIVRSVTPSRQPTRNASAGAPAPKHARGNLMSDGLPGCPSKQYSVHHPFTFPYSYLGVWFWSFRQILIHSNAST